VAVVATGLAGVFCSIMIYHCTRRPLWNGAPTAVRFLLTTVILGLSTALVTTRMATGISAVPPVVGSLRDPISTILIALLTAAGMKLSFEAALFCHLRSKQNTPLKRSARLMTGELAGAAKWRFALGTFGGLMLPLLWLNSEIDVLAPGPAMSLLVVGQFAALLAGELLERYLFFTAVAASRMPGGLRT
jgi:DMSO reductase anchor subunit